MRHHKPGASELVLASLFARALDVESVDRDDDFFARGGDGARLERLVASIDSRLGVEVTPDLVRAYPTPRALALQLRTHRPRGSPTVVALRDHGTLNPVCCFSGGGSPATRMRALADAMPGHPFYGIQARGLEEHTAPDYTVERYTRRALGEIRALRLGGPYVVVGHSFGTIPALELASRLEADGDTVELLVLLDTVAPRWASAPRDPPPDRAGSPSVRRVALRRRPRATSLATKVAVARAGRKLATLTAGVIPRRGLYQYDTFFRFDFLLGRHYVPNPRFRGRTLVVRCEEPFLVEDPKRDDDDLGWGACVLGPVQGVVMPSGHMSMIEPPDVHTLGALIDEALAAEW